MNADESGLQRAWRIWRYVWCALRNLIVIGIALLVFERADTRFQTVTLGLLVLLLVAVAQHSAASYRNYLAQNAALSIDLASIGLALGRLERRAMQLDKAPAEDDELDEIAESEEGMRVLAAGQSEAAKLLKQSQGFYWINVTGCFVLDLIAIWNIVTATLLS